MAHPSENIFGNKKSISMLFCTVGERLSGS